MTSGSLRIGVDASVFTERRAGIGNYVFNLLTELERLPVEATFFLYSPAAIPPECHHFGTIVEGVGPPVKKGPLWLSTGLIPLLRRDGINVFWGAGSFLPLMRLRNVRTVVTIYDLVERFAPATMPTVSRWSHRILKPMAARSASATVAISESTGVEMKQYWGRAPDAVVQPRIDPIFGVPVSDAQVAAVRARYELPDQFLFTLGTLEPRKNLRALLTAYAQARTVADPQGMPKLILGGNAGWLDGEIQSQVERLTAEGSVRWLGYVPQGDLPAIYRACRTFVFVPTYEGFGMPVREALMSGAHVLASDIAALREAGGDAPTFVAPDVASIKAALLQLAQGSLAPHDPRRFELERVEIGSAESFMKVLAGPRGFDRQ
jgi:glycosyltransferase involved in cell wall biosynthesis